MTKTIPDMAIDRRRFLILSGVGGAALAAGQFMSAQASATPASVAAAVKKKIGGRKTMPGKITIDAPEIAENGATVPVSFGVESPMTARNYVKSVHVFADGNPNPDVASFHFTPMCGEARITSRMRLAKTQNLIAVAEMSDGSVYIAKRPVKVTIGGCGG